ncbi:DUF481 domain-containing protein [Sandaracinus amylolyticus]|uniref:DUF481 domain-containing protein n=1 Tax=Sandaracinus amylolyticus TaxID=927083 RepID=A0A0F6W8J0_9BACT|nr:DUF481 domain-containing protein [Sandaracinus amylolyticus]AKF10212.1 hypothetical protein DB32_007361 [Sandaracinus amylolyticus]
MLSRIETVIAALALAGIASLGWAEPALAQPAAAAQHTEAIAAPPEEDADDEVFTIQLGGTLNFGNSRSLQLAGATNFLIHRDQHLFTLDLQATLGLAALRDNTTREWSDFEDNARNILGRLRYDFFLDPDDALFASVGGRHDTFAGLDFRFQGQLGYLRNIFREGPANEHRLWGELGFDVTVDDRYPNPLPNPAADPETCGMVIDGMPTPACFLPNLQDQYSVRVFLGYDNHMNEAWQFRTGLEALFDVVDGENVRLTSISEFRLRIDNNLAAGLRFTLLFDNVPVPGTDSVDTTTVLTLVYTLL